MAKYVKTQGKLFTCHIEGGNMSIITASDSSSTQEKLMKDLRSRGMRDAAFSIREATDTDIAHFKGMGGAIW